MDDQEFLKLNYLKKILNKLHEKIAMKRRVEVLSKEISNFLPDRCSVLDVGCGSGEISKQITLRKKNILMSGVDLIVREDCKINVQSFDGYHLPFEDKSFDYVLIVDVLHHMSDPLKLLDEAIRVSKTGIIVKDHNCESRRQRIVMTITDTLGNWHHDVPLIFNFLSKKTWDEIWKYSELSIERYITNFGLYPKIRGFIFARDMDFIAYLKKS